MQYILFVFSSRDGAMAAYDYCLMHRISADVVNTPREVSASCGVSVKVGYAQYGYVIRFVTGLSTYAGAYLVTNAWGHRTYRRLYN